MLADYPKVPVYLVTPCDGGKGVLVTHNPSRSSSLLRIGEYAIDRYSRLPKPDETYQDWKGASGAVDDGDSKYQSPPTGTLAVVFGGVKIEPPLSNESDIEQAAGVIAAQFLRYQNNPCAPNTIVGDLVAANVPFDAVHTDIHIRRQ